MINRRTGQIQYLASWQHEVKSQRIFTKTSNKYVFSLKTNNINFIVVKVMGQNTSYCNQKYLLTVNVCNSQCIKSMQKTFLFAAAFLIKSSNYLFLPLHRVLYTCLILFKLVFVFYSLSSIMRVLIVFKCTFYRVFILHFASVLLMFYTKNFKLLYC